jgi:hypothetical protein
MHRLGAVAVFFSGLGLLLAPPVSGQQGAPGKETPELLLASLPEIPELDHPPPIKQPAPPLSSQPGPPEVEILPLPLSSPSAIRPGTTVDSLSAKGKLDMAIRNMVGPRALANRALLAGLDLWMDDPDEWRSGMPGYGLRFADRMGRLAVRNGIQVTADIIFKTDPRYDRCDCTGGWPRAKHALKRIIIARKDDGGEMLSVSRLAAAYATPMITDQWYPSSKNTWFHKIDSGTFFLGWRGVSNLLKEFWPDISRTLRIKREWMDKTD